MSQQIKDLAFSLQWLGLLLWCRSDPWPWNLCMPWAQLPKKIYTYVEIGIFYMDFLYK